MRIIEEAGKVLFRVRVNVCFIGHFVTDVIDYSRERFKREKMAILRVPMIFRLYVYVTQLRLFQCMQAFDACPIIAHKKMELA